MGDEAPVVPDTNADDEEGKGGEQPPKLTDKQEQTEDEKRKAAHQAAVDDAVKQRKRAQKAEQMVAERDAKNAELENRLAEIETKLKANPQSQKPDDDERMKVVRELAETRATVKKLSESVEEGRRQVEAEKVKARVAMLVNEGQFIAPDAVAQLLSGVIVVEGGECILNVMDDGEPLKVSANLENLLKYKPIPNFDQFIKTKGAPGAGSSRPGNGKIPADGIDRERVRNNDVAYIQQNMEAITKLKAAGKL